MSYASKTMQTMPMNGIMTSTSVPFLPKNVCLQRRESDRRGCSIRSRSEPPRLVRQ